MDMLPYIGMLSVRTGARLRGGADVVYNCCPNLEYFRSAIV